ncbi:MAG: hypothetical protein GY714_23635 [Desulfobacterales bacterium]|nr:hypothetical protein [Desulfobacterales bacterium]
MENNYLQELFRLDCLNNFYKDGLEGVFEMEPTESGQKVLDSYNLHFKKQESGFVVAAPFSGKDDNGCELRKPFEDDAKLSFAIFTNDKYFLEHSELPANDSPGDYVYYFNNLDESKRNTSLLIDVEAVRGTERVRLHTHSFSFEKTGEQHPVVRNCHGEVIPVAEYDSAIDEIKKQYIVDLTRKGDGLYTVEYNSVSTIYYCQKASFIRRVPLVVVEIFTNPDVPEAYRIIKKIGDKQYIDPKAFRLHFGVYVLYWRYRIIPEDVSSLTRVKVKTNKDEYTFSPESRRVNACQDHLIFTSDQVINKLDKEIETGLYKLTWFNHHHCWCYNHYYYCDQNYGIHVGFRFMCRKQSYDHYGKIIYNHECPAYCEDILIGQLPKPDEVKTDYYYEDEKYIAEMTLYLTQDCDEYQISETSSK